MPKSREPVSSSSSVSDCDGEVDKKLRRKRQVTPEKPVQKQDGETSRALSPSKQSNDSRDDNMFQTRKMRSIGVWDFKGKVLVNIKEYWMEIKPERKGISLNPEQWSQLKEWISDTDDAVRKRYNQSHIKPVLF
ncbi:hypothetical protein MC885_000392 [Smutsia gigantea]|nr:hypothetical protein MC885_000392 [Smutsia gigantea]